MTLDPRQIDQYLEVGAIVVTDVLTREEVHRLRGVTDEFVEKSKSITKNDEIYDLEDSHTAALPRVRRIKSPELHHPVFRELVRHKRISAVLNDLMGPDIRFDVGKLNMKAAGGGAAVEWHQDWAFYPHTNDNLAAVGVMMDDMELVNGPLMIVPGTHKGPIFDHHCNGRFCGAMDPSRGGVDYSKAVPLTGSAGSLTVHHVRTVHGSAPNDSNKERRLLLLQYRAADAWPLLGFSQGMEAYNKLMVTGTFSNIPRLEPVPVRLPMPGNLDGTIFEIQKNRKRRYY